MRCRAVPYVPLRSAQLWPVAVQAPVRRDGPAPDPDCLPVMHRCIARRALLTVPILAVRVELSSLIARSNVDLREVANTQDLNIVRGLYEVCAGDGTVGDEPCPVAGLDAPCDLDTLGFSNSRAGAGLRRAVNTPVINAVDFNESSVSAARFRLGREHTI